MISKRLAKACKFEDELLYFSKCKVAGKTFGLSLPRFALVRLSRLQTEVGRFCLTLTSSNAMFQLNVDNWFLSILRFEFLFKKGFCFTSQHFYKNKKFSVNSVLDPLSLFKFFVCITFLCICIRLHKFQLVALKKGNLNRIRVTMSEFLCVHYPATYT